MLTSSHSGTSETPNLAASSFRTARYKVNICTTIIETHHLIFRSSRQLLGDPPSIFCCCRTRRARTAAFMCSMYACTAHSGSRARMASLISSFPNTRFAALSLTHRWQPQKHDSCAALSGARNRDCDEFFTDVFELGSLPAPFKKRFCLAARENHANLIAEFLIQLRVRHRAGEIANRVLEDFRDNSAVHQLNLHLHTVLCYGAVGFWIHAFPNALDIRVIHRLVSILAKPRFASDQAHCRAVNYGEHPQAPL